MRGVLLSSTQTRTRNLIYDFHAEFRQNMNIVSTQFDLKIRYILLSSYIQWLVKKTENAGLFFGIAAAATNVCL